jgi:excisionase family DNA binding protein
MEPNDQPSVLTVDELRLRLRCGRRAAYEAIARGEVPGVIRLGRSIRISTAAVDRWLNGDGEVTDGNN